MKVRITLVVVLLALATLGMVWAKGAFRKESSPVAEGERLAAASGCYACHAQSEHDPRVNFRASASGRFRARSVPTFWENGIERAARIKEWIREGVPEDERERHERLLIQMPAYGGRHLDEGEIDAIAAWILVKGMAMTGANGNADLELPEEIELEALSEDQLLAYGDRLSRQQGCYQCHGELGQGGVENPGSFKNYIPGFAGKDFLELTDRGSREEIRHWIAKGRGKRVEKGLKGRFAKRYFERQAVGMPGYEPILDGSQIELLVEYLLYLNKLGPLSAADVESLNQRISQHVKHETSN